MILVVAMRHGCNRCGWMVPSFYNMIPVIRSPKHPVVQGATVVLGPAAGKWVTKLVGLLALFY